MGINIFILVFLVILFLSYNSLIYYRHLGRREKIKIRIHVNGTRGKSSVTRLIAAGLRERGIRTLAKVTGTEAAIIYPDGTEKPIPRLEEKGNIIEQIYVFKEAIKAGAEAAVVECMALRSGLQKISEEKLINSTLGVITNIRPDHMDVMGPTIKDVGEAILNTVPRNGTLVTMEKEFLGMINRKTGQLNTKLIQAPEGVTITNEMMSEFKYLEHRDNVALALAACEYLGIPRDVALRGMHKANPDPGVLRTFKIYEDGKYIEFINALATNDPFSLMAIWQRMLRKITEEQLKIILINCRKDRFSRSLQLVQLVAQDLPTDYCMLVGEATRHIAGTLVRNGLNQDKIIDMGITKPDLVFQNILCLMHKSSAVFAIGNMADRLGLGIGIVRYFEERSRAN